MKDHTQVNQSVPMDQQFARSRYTQPRLLLLGDITTLTETGSMTGMEDYVSSPFCFLANMTYNMC